MAPRPTLGVRRERRGRCNDDGFQRNLLVGAREFTRCLWRGLLENHQREPWTQTVAGGLGWRVSIDQLLVVEFNERQIVRLEISDPIDRFRSHHRVAIDALNVSRRQQGEVFVSDLRVQAHVHRHGRSFLHRAATCAKGIGLVYASPDALPQPRVERVLPDAQRHAALAMSSSCELMT